MKSVGLAPTFLTLIVSTFGCGDFRTDNSTLPVAPVVERNERQNSTRVDNSPEHSALAEFTSGEELAGWVEHWQRRGYEYAPGYVTVSTNLDSTSADYRLALIPFQKIDDPDEAIYISVLKVRAQTSTDAFVLRLAAPVVQGQFDFEYIPGLDVWVADASSADWKRHARALPIESALCWKCVLRCAAAITTGACVAASRGCYLSAAGYLHCMGTVCGGAAVVSAVGCTIYHAVN